MADPASEKARLLRQMALLSSRLGARKRAREKAGHRGAQRSGPQKRARLNRTSDSKDVGQAAGAADFRSQAAAALARAKARAAQASGKPKEEIQSSSNGKSSLQSDLRSQAAAALAKAKEQAAGAKQSAKQSVKQGSGAGESTKQIAQSDMRSLAAAALARAKEQAAKAKERAAGAKQSAKQSVKQGSGDVKSTKQVAQSDMRSLAAAALARAKERAAGTKQSVKQRSGAVKSTKTTAQSDMRSLAAAALAKAKERAAQAKKTQIKDIRIASKEKMVDSTQSDLTNQAAAALAKAKARAAQAKEQDTMPATAPKTRKPSSLTATAAAALAQAKARLAAREQKSFRTSTPLESKAPGQTPTPGSGIPCLRWPRCKFKARCKHAHPTDEELLLRGCSPLKVSLEKDVIPLLGAFKNNTAPLIGFLSLIEARLARAAQLRRTRPPRPQSRDSLLELMGLPPMRDVLMKIKAAPTGSGGKSTGGPRAPRVTSDRDWASEHRDSGSFAIVRIGGEFLLRHYAPTPPAKRAVSVESSRRTAPAERTADHIKRMAGLGASFVESEEYVQGRSSDKAKEFPVEASNLCIMVTDAIKPDNKGFALLRKMGWKKGVGLGKKEEGDTEPVQVRFTVTRSF